LIARIADGDTAVDIGITYTYRVRATNESASGQGFYKIAVELE